MLHGSGRSLACSTAKQAQQKDIEDAADPLQKGRSNSDSCWREERLADTDTAGAAS